MALGVCLLLLRDGTRRVPTTIKRVSSEKMYLKYSIVNRFVSCQALAAFFCALIENGGTEI